MRLDHALNKIGIQLVRQHSADPSASTLLLRVPPAAIKNWATVVEEFLLAAEKQPVAAAKWTADVSRVYFIDKASKTARYLWRIVLSGNPSMGAEILGMAIIRTLSEGVEVTSQPLVGRITPGPGEMKGAHPIGTAQRLVASHFTSGGGQS